MMHSETLPPPVNMPLTGKRRMFSAYEWFWSFMAALAAVSLATMMFWPDVAAQIVGVKARANAAAAPAKEMQANAPHDVAKAISEVLALRQRTGVLQADIDKIRADMSSLTDSNNAAAANDASQAPPGDPATPAMNEAAKALAVTDEMAAREQDKASANDPVSPGPISVVTSVMPPHADTAPAAPEAARSRLGQVELPATPAPTVTGSLPDPVPASAAPEAPAATAKTKAPEKVAMVATVPDVDIPKPTKKPAVVKQAKVETGAISPAPTSGNTPIAFGPAVVTKAPEAVGIIIGSGPSVDSIRLHWTSLVDQQREPLKGLEARYITGSDNTGQVFRLVAGPIKSAGDAKKVCKSLEDSGVSCSVGKFTGNAL